MDWARALTPPEWREIERAKLEELHRTGQPVRYEKEYLRKDGSRVPIELLVHLRKDDEGQPAFYYSFLTDLTERKQAEASPPRERKPGASAGGGIRGPAWKRRRWAFSWRKMPSAAG